MSDDVAALKRTIDLLREHNMKITEENRQLRAKLGYPPDREAAPLPEEERPKGPVTVHVHADLVPPKPKRMAFTFRPLKIKPQPAPPKAAPAVAPAAEPKRKSKLPMYRGELPLRTQWPVQGDTE